MSTTTAVRPDGRRAGSTGSEQEKADMSETPKQMFNVEAPENEQNVEMDEKEKNRILRKIDWAIVVRFDGSLSKRDLALNACEAIQRTSIPSVLPGPSQYRCGACGCHLRHFSQSSSIGQARVAGMLPALQMSNREYQIALTVFFVSYVAVEGELPLMLLGLG